MLTLAGHVVIYISFESTKLQSAAEMRVMRRPIGVLFFAVTLHLIAISKVQRGFFNLYVNPLSFTGGPTEINSRN